MQPVGSALGPEGGLARRDEVVDELECRVLGEEEEEQR